MVWFLVAGALFLGVAVTASILERLPITVSVLYLGVGMALGPWGTGVPDIDPGEDAEALELVTEVAVVISLFGAGLKMRMPLRAPGWRRALRQAGPAMVLTVGLTAVVGWWAMGLGLGAAILLGAVLAPTDPVLASEVQVRDAFDRDALRGDLTAEAGLNDGTAFPFVVLGTGLVAAGSAGAFDWGSWLGLDLVWPVLGGPVIGWLVATVVGRGVLWMRRRHGHAVGLDEFLALGIVGTSYGLAVLAGTYGFLAAFAAGVAVRAIELGELGERVPDDVRNPSPDAAVHEERAPAWMAHAVLDQSQRLERIASLGVVVMLGALLAAVSPSPAKWAIPIALLFVIRPVAVALSLMGMGLSRAPLPHRLVRPAWHRLALLPVIRDRRRRGRRGLAAGARRHAHHGGRLGGHPWALCDAAS